MDPQDEDNLILNSLVELLLLIYPNLGLGADILQKMQDYVLNWGFMCWKHHRLTILHIPIEKRNLHTLSLFDHLSKFNKVGYSSDAKLSEIIDSFIDSIELFKSVTQKKIVQILLQDSQIKKKFSETNSETGLTVKKHFENQLLE